MAEDESIKRLEARLTRLEATLSQTVASGGAGAGLPIGAIADPGPYPPYGGGWGGWRPFPVVDPATYAFSTRLPNAVVDPGPYPPYGGGGGGWGGWRPHPIVDSATFANSALARVGPIGDPPPIDVSRFSVAQLEATLHSINAEKARLSSIEAMVKQQLEKLKGRQE
jgi:hypothetical protein